MAGSGRMLLFVSFYFPISFHLDSTFLWTPPRALHPRDPAGTLVRSRERHPGLSHPDARKAGTLSSRISRNRSLNFHSVSMENKRKQKATCGRGLPSGSLPICHPSGNCRGPNKSARSATLRFCNRHFKFGPSKLGVACIAQVSISKLRTSQICSDLDSFHLDGIPASG